MQKSFMILLCVFVFIPLFVLQGQDAITEEEARLVLDKWLETQNQGNFDKYAELYGTGFKGIKRSGDVAAAYNRDNWLQDRKGMFKAKMQVTARDIEVMVKGAGADIRFIQVWASGSFKDAGTKLLNVEKTAHQVKILAEEMVDSYIIDNKVQQGVKGDLPFIVLADKYLILSQDTETDWSQGSITAIPGQDYPVVAVSGTDWKKIPTAFKKYTNLTVNLYSGTGQCVLGQVTALKLVAAVIPHFSTQEEWKSTGTGTGQAIWEEAGEEGHYLAAEVQYSALQTFTGGIVLASVFGVTDLKLMQDIEVSAAGYNLVKNALDREQLLDPVLLEEGGWDAGTNPLDFLEEFSNSKGTHFLSLQVLLTPLCSSNEKEVGVFWELGKNALIPRLTVSGLCRLLLSFDINGNGMPDLLFHDPFTGYFLYVDYKEAFVIKIPYHDCPC